MIYGLGLPDDVLEKVYHRNAEELFARFKNSKVRGSDSAWTMRVTIDESRYSKQSET